jgi:hypothetical protein
MFALAFADDLVLLAPSSLALQHLLNHFVAFCNENNLEVNVGKTKAMFVNCDGQMKVLNREIETVKEFRYLGLNIVNHSSKPDKLLLDRILMA